MRSLLVLPILVACSAEPAGPGADESGAPPPVAARSDTGGTAVKTRLPRSLSPRARKALLTAESGTRIPVSIEFAPAADVAALTRELEALGARVRSADESTRLLDADVEADRLDQVADLDAVVYVETGDRLAPAGSAP